MVDRLTKERDATIRRLRGALRGLVGSLHRCARCDCVATKRHPDGRKNTRWCDRCADPLAIDLPGAEAIRAALAALEETEPTEEHDQREAQRRSFAYGNAHLENESVTRNVVDEAAEALSKLTEERERVYPFELMREGGDWLGALREAITRKGGIEMRGGEIPTLVHRGHLESALAELEHLRELVEHLRLKAGRQQARCAVFMQAMATLAREGQQARAQRWIARADRAAADVRPEDFVVAKP